MKRLLLVLAAFFVMSALVLAQSGIAGKWAGEQTIRGTTQKIALELKMDGGKVTGTLTMGTAAAVPITDTKLVGMKVTFNTVTTDRGAEIASGWSAELKGDELAFGRIPYQAPPAPGAAAPAGGGGGGGGGGGADPRSPAPVMLKRTK